MQGMMMDYPLTLHHFLERAARFFPNKEIVTRAPQGLHRYTYQDYSRRVHRLARALERLGVQPGDRVGTLAWNTARHLELYFAVPCYGAVLHTLNLRLPQDQLRYIITHAEDKVIFADASLASILEEIKGDLPTVRQFVIMDDAGGAETSLQPSVDYEELLASVPAEPYPWPRLDENAACAMCYTSGTTGNPKGVVYSHRALFLHSYGLAMADGWGLCESDVVLQIVPMFHANGWGAPFAAVMTGAKIVLPGRHPEIRDLAQLIEGERATVTLGVPTIWIGLYDLLQQEEFDLSSLRFVASAGSAIPRRLVEAFEREHGVRIVQNWGMTETTPIATLSQLKSHMSAWPEHDRFGVRAKQGIPLAGVDIRAVDEEGREVPWDGKTLGELQVRGPWVTGGYYNDPRSAGAFVDGWFRTGDVVSIDAEGYIQIADRTKDLIKSGGEWISSVELENHIMAHPKVLEAAVIAVEHPKWQERPLAVVVPQARYRGQLSKQEILEFLQPRVVKWWLPDDVVFIDAVPKTSVGKFDKKVLRQQFQHHQLPATVA
ncbi:MAG TPA: long-chain fatty acid--CoA ligase [Bryobacterales bacterium]|nr:long-chain fatty acid--CoA ligase [Bryobacterales bacterium]